MKLSSDGSLVFVTVLQRSKDKRSAVHDSGLVRKDPSACLFSISNAEPISVVRDATVCHLILRIDD